MHGHGPSGSASIRGLGSTDSLTLGGAVAPGLVLAGTLQVVSVTADFKRGPTADATLNTDGNIRSASHKAEGGTALIGMLVDWYPRPTGGWHTGAAAGVGAIGLTNLADDTRLGGVNLGGSLFGGYDWPLKNGRDWALGLQLVVSGATETKLKNDSGREDSGYRLTPLAVGLQASLLYF